MEEAKLSKRAKGKRYRGEELKQKVRSQCALEFRERWPSIDPDSAKAHVEAFQRQYAANAAAKSAKQRLSDVLKECIPLARLEGEHLVFSYVTDLRMVEPVLSLLDRTLKNTDMLIMDSNAWSATGITAAVMTREIDGVFTFRDAVYWAFSMRPINQAGTPTARQLAVASLMAGQEFDTVRDRDYSEFEIIRRETRAMREVERNRRWMTVGG